MLCGCVFGNYILHPSGVHIAAGHNDTVDSQKNQVKADNKAYGKQGNDWPDDHQTAKNNSHNVQNHRKIIEKFSSQTNKREMSQSGYGMGDKPNRKKHNSNQFSGIWIHQKHQSGKNAKDSRNQRNGTDQNQYSGLFSHKIQYRKFR